MLADSAYGLGVRSLWNPITGWSTDDVAELVRVMSPIWV